VLSYCFAKYEAPVGREKRRIPRVEEESIAPKKKKGPPGLSGGGKTFLRKIKARFKI